jgi:hypothetical protein
MVRSLSTLVTVLALCVCTSTGQDLPVVARPLFDEGELLKLFTSRTHQRPPSTAPPAPESIPEPPKLEEVELERELAPELGQRATTPSFDPCLADPCAVLAVRAVRHTTPLHTFPAFISPRIFTNLAFHDPPFYAGRSQHVH